jgi:hypothetical protein
VFADQVQAVVPVTGADQWQAVFTELEAVQDGSDTVLVKTRRLFRALGQMQEIWVAVKELSDLRRQLKQTEGVFRKPTQSWSGPADERSVRC